MSAAQLLSSSKRHERDGAERRASGQHASSSKGQIAQDIGQPAAAHNGCVNQKGAALPAVQPKPKRQRNKFKQQLSTADARAAAQPPPEQSHARHGAAGEASSAPSHAVSAPATAHRKKKRRRKHGTAAAQQTGGAAQQASPPLPTTTAAPIKGAAVSANWAALRASMGPSKKRKPDPAAAAAPVGDAEQAPKRPERVGDTEGLTPVLALDCEMVGVGPDGVRSSLARVCVVNNAGAVLLDEHVAQRERVTDYRTRFSGIRSTDLVGAPPLEQMAARVAAMFKGRVIVGHAITNDLTALLLGHPRKLVRDTARYPPLMRASAPGRRPKPRALRSLALEHLGLTIQEGEHSPVDDARAALYLYHKHRKEWEMHMERGTLSQLKAPRGRVASKGALGKAGKSLEELAAADDMVDL